MFLIALTAFPDWESNRETLDGLLHRTRECGQWVAGFIPNYHLTPDRGPCYVELRPFALVQENGLLGV